MQGKNHPLLIIQEIKPPLKSWLLLRKYEQLSLKMITVQFQIQQTETMFSTDNRIHDNIVNQIDHNEIPIKPLTTVVIHLHVRVVSN